MNGSERLEELGDGLWTWAARHRRWRPGDFGAQVRCYAARADDDTLLVIDPLLPARDDGAAVLRALDGLVGRRVAILVTIVHHLRSAIPLWRRWRDTAETTILGHAAVGRGLARAKAGDAFRALTPGDEGPGGVRAFAIGTRPVRTEQPLWLASHQAVVFGDAVVEDGGALRVWSHAAVDERRDRWYHEFFNPTLQPLVDLAPTRILVTHGRPVLADGAAALAAAMAAPAWSLAIKPPTR